MEPKIILAIDVGLKRIGVAKCINGIALCLDPILRKNRNQAANAVRSLVVESNASVLVVGIPLSSDSSEQMQRRIKHFVGLLELGSHIEIIFFDESFSSKEALERLDDKKMRKKAHSKNGSLDSLAALVILERYLMR
ncbi:Holliday junction resolvase RuvX [uncultured Helicobacter sp.]|uniref:Holliday junction resolvase RuvX n=1 Tax=uncultured Helicobacter sp. TaxID=175537 RepID=UPI00261CFE57|nr:Holliday junction resolvase RuvX [uncultured Helicobacter sp.]